MDAVITGAVIIVNARDGGMSQAVSAGSPRRRSCVIGAHAIGRAALVGRLQRSSRASVAEFPAASQPLLSSCRHQVRDILRQPLNAVLVVPASGRPVQVAVMPKFVSFDKTVRHVLFQTSRVRSAPVTRS